MPHSITGDLEVDGDATFSNPVTFTDSVTFSQPLTTTDLVVDGSLLLDGLGDAVAGSVQVSFSGFGADCGLLTTNTMTMLKLPTGADTYRFAFAYCTDNGGYRAVARMSRRRGPVAQRRPVCSRSMAESTLNAFVESSCLAGLPVCIVLCGVVL